MSVPVLTPTADAGTTQETTTPSASSTGTEATVPATQSNPNEGAKPQEDGAEGSATNGSQTFDWKSWVEGATPQEIRDLLSHNRFAGTLGNVVQRQVQAMLKAKEAEEASRAKAEELKRLRDEDPYEYVRKEREAEQEIERVAQLRSEAMNAITDFQAALPEEVQNKVSGKTYDGKTWKEGFKSYIADIVDAAVQHELSTRLTQAQKKWETDRVPALRKEILADIQKGKPSSEIVSGASTPGDLTQSEWDRNRRDSDWRRVNKERINRALAAGKIRS